MKSSIKIFAFALFIATAIVSCVDDSVTEEYCRSQVEIPISTVTGPETGTVGQEVKFQMRYNTGNGCFKRAEIVQSGTNPKQISVVAFYEGCVCTQATLPVLHDYKFTPAAAGEYTFKFKSLNNTFITKTVTVTQ